ncbi:MmcQ/YjbR family DNA-binding protein [Rhodococcus opacus]|uniref:MmcQ/YjbR family DNA-binding protein n=1 Tax=Rhodococcus TaxID=1827 RepID=UPI00146B6A43|nr:MmcQ/YjbR family DNA-binding protein [Rhodococcus sp. IEGM 1351]MDI9935264.1 MmcQ/YjbR family DNA-binding protein [Rhodococcus sp. IEGM 1351]WKN57510.1 MmcQ/YjbR family DNA-binding protein [Rhodococcus opacus]
MTLSGKDIQKKAQDVAGRLPGTSSGYPFTEHLRVWKVAGKVFLIVTEDDPELEIITVKVDPHHGDALRREHDAISRGHYLHKDHWISVRAGEGITRSLVEDLVHGSYELTEEKLPAKDRPE